MSRTWLSSASSVASNTSRSSAAGSHTIDVVSQARADMQRMRSQVMGGSRRVGPAGSPGQRAGASVTSVNDEGISVSFASPRGGSVDRVTTIDANTARHSVGRLARQSSEQTNTRQLAPAHSLRDSPSTANPLSTTAQSTSQPQSRSHTNAAVYDAAIPDASPARPMDTGADGALEDGWTSYISTDERPGERCYVNLNTGALQWEKPTPLPAGWVQQASKTSKKTYYYNKFTGESQWEVPHAPCVPIRTETKLPPNWTAHKTTNAYGGAEGDRAVYYFNFRTGISQFHVPEFVRATAGEYVDDGDGETQLLIPDAQKTMWTNTPTTIKSATMTERLVACYEGLYECGPRVCGQRVGRDYFGVLISFADMYAIWNTEVKVHCVASMLLAVVAIAIEDQWFGLDGLYNKFEWKTYISEEFLTYVGGSVYFMIVFRSGIAYSRYWAVLDVFDEVGAAMTNLVRFAVMAVPRTDKVRRDEIRRYCKLFYHLIIMHVRPTEEQRKASDFDYFLAVGMATQTEVDVLARSFSEEDWRDPRPLLVIIWLTNIVDDLFERRTQYRRKLFYDRLARDEQRKYLDERDFLSVPWGVQATTICNTFRTDFEGDNEVQIELRNFLDTIKDVEYDFEKLEEAIVGMSSEFCDINMQRFSQFPFPFAQLQVAMSCMLCYIMPFIQVRYYGIYMLPALCFVNALLIFGLAAVSVGLEDPMGTDRHDLPIHDYLDRAIKDLQQAESQERHDYLPHDFFERKKNRKVFVGKDMEVGCCGSRPKSGFDLSKSSRVRITQHEMQPIADTASINFIAVDVTAPMSR